MQDGTNVLLPSYDYDEQSGRVYVLGPRGQRTIQIGRIQKKTHQPFKQACLSSSTSVCGFCFYRMQTAEYTTMTMTMFDAIYILVFFTPVMCVHVCVSLPSCCGAALFFVGTNHTPLNRPNYRTQWLVLLMTNIMATATL